LAEPRPIRTPLRETVDGARERLHDVAMRFHDMERCLSDNVSAPPVPRPFAGGIRLLAFVSLDGRGVYWGDGVCIGANGRARSPADVAWGRSHRLRAAAHPRQGLTLAGIGPGCLWLAGGVCRSLASDNDGVRGVNPRIPCVPGSRILNWVGSRWLPAVFRHDGVHPIDPVSALTDARIVSAGRFYSVSSLSLPGRAGPRLNGHRTPLNGAAFTDSSPMVRDSEIEYPVAVNGPYR